MRKYEVVFILSPSLSEKEALERFSYLVKKNGGKIVKVERWGLRDLSYEIKKKDKGIYYLTHIIGDGSLVKDLENNVRLDDKFLRLMAIRLETGIKKEDLNAMEEVDITTFAKEEEK